MKRERVRTRHGFKGLGKFFLGCFIGFIAAILTIAGLGYWAYSSITVRKIEKWTKNDITNNKMIEELTLKKAVGIISGFASNNPEAYTLAKFEEDFNITLIDEKNAPFGLDLSIIKNASIKNIGQAVNDTIDTITFSNVLKFLDVNNADIGMLNNALEKTTTYYIYNGKMYANMEHTIEVGFKYTIEGDTVKIANSVHTIKSNIIEPMLMNLPLDVAITKFSDVANSLKIYEILDYKYDSVTEKYYEKYENGNYIGEVSGIMNAIAEYSIDDFSDQSKINDLQIFEVLGYYYNETDKNYYTSSNFAPNTKVAGVINALAGKTLEDLSKQETIEDLYIYQVMDYTRTEVASNPITYIYKDASNNTVEGIMETIAGKKISQLDDNGAFNDILVADALGYKVDKLQNKVYQSDGTTPVTGVVKHLALMDSTISSIAADVKKLEISQILDLTPGDSNNSSIINALCAKNATIDTLDQKIKEITLGEILGVEKGAEGNSPVIEALYTSTISTLNADINNLTLGKALNIEIEETSGVIKALYGTSISGLKGKIDSLQVYEVMGYYYNEGDDCYYTTSTFDVGTKVEGVMRAIADSNINSIGSDIDGLTVDKIFDSESSVVKLLGEDASTTTITNLTTVLPNKINTTTIGDLIDLGMINAESINPTTIALIEGYTISGFIAEYEKLLKSNI